MLPTINTSFCFVKWGRGIFSLLSCLPACILKGWTFNLLHLNALLSWTWEAVVWQTDRQEMTVSFLALQPGVLLFSFSAVALFWSTKREVSSITSLKPSPQPLTGLCSAPSWIAMTNREKKNNCRSRKQICLIFFFFFNYDLCYLAMPHSPHSGCLESFEICLSSVVFADAIDQPVQGL